MIRAMPERKRFFLRMSSLKQKAGKYIKQKAGKYKKKEKIKSKKQEEKFELEQSISATIQLCVRILRLAFRAAFKK